MLDPLALIHACNHCYALPMYTAGPDGRDAATVTQIDGQTVLVFRGTVTDGAAAMLDWLNDLRAQLVYRDGFPGLVHAGFADSLDNLLLLLPRFSEPPVITGHSKGGALAMLFGMWLFMRYGLESRIITFAAPRCGNDVFAATAERVLHVDRYENPHDLIPRLPHFGYMSAGYLITPSARWTAPHGVHENHSLDTGYRPWIEMDRPQPNKQAA